MTSMKDALILALIAGGKQPREIADAYGLPMALIDHIIAQDMQRRESHAQLDR